MAALVELDLRTGDTYLAQDMGALSGTFVIGHDTGLATVQFPAPPFWAVLEPDDPSSREDVLVQTLSGTTITAARGFAGSVNQPHKVGSRLRLGVRAGVTVEPFHPVGGAGEPSFANSWVNFGGGNAGARFAMDPFGIVHLSGLVKSGGIPNTIYTLPGGYRPLTPLRFPVVSNGLFGQCNVLATGDVQAIVGSNTWFSLEGITFRAEQ